MTPAEGFRGHARAQFVRDVATAAEERGWLVVEIGAHSIRLEDLYGTSLDIEGLLVGPEFIRSLPLTRDMRPREDSQ